MVNKNKVAIISFGYLDPKGTGGGVISWYLAEALHKLGCLDRLIIFSKGRHKTEFSCSESIPFTKYYLYIRWLIQRTIGKWMKVPFHIFRGVDERLFDFFCRRLIDHSANILLVTHPVFPKTLKRSRKMGITTILLAPNPYEMVIKELILDEKRKYAIKNEDGYTSGFRLKEIAKCFSEVDYIVSLSSVISESYVRHGCKWKVIDVKCPVGINFEVFKEEVKRQDNKFRVFYIAHTVLLKGLQYLLEAWENIDKEGSELVVGSDIDKNVMEIIKKRFSDLDNIRYVGHVEDINIYFRQSSVFVCSSLIDGGPRTVYEAMACGLPVIVTEGCGAKDIIDNGIDGFVVPIRNADAIKEKILWLREHPEEATQMGFRARKKIEKYPIKEFADKISETVCMIKK